MGRTMPIATAGPPARGETGNGWGFVVETGGVKPAGDGELAARMTAEAESPWFSGHFPDNPILPGVAQLKMVADLVAAAGKNLGRLVGLSRVKFRKIVRPGELLDIHLTIGKVERQYVFRITCGNEEACSGMMFFAQPDEETEVP